MAHGKQGLSNLAPGNAASLALTLRSAASRLLPISMWAWITASRIVIGPAWIGFLVMHNHQDFYLDHRQETAAAACAGKAKSSECSIFSNTSLKRDVSESAVGRQARWLAFRVKLGLRSFRGL